MPKVWYIYENGFNIGQSSNLNKAIQFITKKMPKQEISGFYSSDYKTYFKSGNFIAKLEEIKK